MAIVWKQGNLLTSRARILVNPVNCVGVSGAGLAKQFARLYPEATSLYQRWCKMDSLDIGMILVRDPVLYFPTKKHWREPSRLEYIESGLEFFRNKFIWKAWSSYAFPPLGCGLGGLKWADVKPLLIRYLDDLSIEIEVYEPYANARLQVSRWPSV